MKKENTMKENIEFLIKMYERELESAAQNRTLEEMELIESYLTELKTIIELSKDN